MIGPAGRRLLIALAAGAFVAPGAARADVTAECDFLEISARPATSRRSTAS